MIEGYNELLSWMEKHLLACPSKTLLHIDCPGCGLQRSLLLLLKGDLADSLPMYPATIPILILAAFTFLHMKFQFKAGAAIIKYLYALIAIVVALFYIYKIITLKIFD